MEVIRFGPAGNGESFAAMGYQSNRDVPEYIVRMGLGAYEYQCGRGVRVSADVAAALLAKAEPAGVRLSLHAPYFISLSSVEEEKRRNSVGYILESARAARSMGALRVVVHTGSASKITRAEAMALAADTLRTALEALDAEGLGDIILCPETMGKINQLGTLEEVLELCRLDERMLPCVDFGHLNARTRGGLRTEEDFDALLGAMENAIGGARAKVFHAHFSKIQYTEGGEKKHLTFEDTEYGPEFEPLARVLARRGMTPTIICESDGTQAEDAAAMQRLYREASAALVK